MATVQLANVYEPTTFNQAVQEASIRLNAFSASGVMVSDPRIDAMASTGGSLGDLPFYLGLADVEPNYSDDTATASTPQNLSSAKQIWRLSNMNQSWAAMDLARELALADPLMAITDRVGQYWANALERRIVQSALGILADNVANDASDMLYSVSANALTLLPEHQVSPTAVAMAAATMGDHATSLSVIAMHSAVFTTLQIAEKIDFVRASEIDTRTIPYYLGYRVVVDDILPVTAGTNQNKYTSILFGGAAFGHGAGRVETPSEVDRNASAGNGGGETVLHSRRADIIHPGGFAWSEGSVAGQSPTEAELANALNWNRVYANRKNVPVAFLETDE